MGTVKWRSLTRSLKSRHHSGSPHGSSGRENWEKHGLTGENRLLDLLEIAETVKLFSRGQFGQEEYYTLVKLKEVRMSAAGRVTKMKDVIKMYQESQLNRYLGVKEEKLRFGCPTKNNTTLYSPSTLTAQDSQYSSVRGEAGSAGAWNSGSGSTVSWKQ